MSVTEFEVPTEKVVPVNETNDDKEENIEEDIDEDDDKNVVDHRAKAKIGTEAALKKAATKGLLIKKPKSVSGGKHKREESQSTKGPGTALKIAIHFKSFGVAVKGPGPSGKASTTKEKDRDLLDKGGKKFLKLKKYYEDIFLIPKLLVYLGWLSC